MLLWQILYLLGNDESWRNPLKTNDKNPVPKTYMYPTTAIMKFQIWPFKLVSKKREKKNYEFNARVEPEAVLTFEKNAATRKPNEICKFKYMK